MPATAKDFEEAIYDLDYMPLGAEFKSIIIEALRIAAEQVGEREKVVAVEWGIVGPDGEIGHWRGATERGVIDRFLLQIGGDWNVWREMGYRAVDIPAAATPVSGWRSMDSAPRDGTRVLLWYEELEPHTIQGQWDADFGWVDVWNADKIEGDSGSIWPTHWQPLPSPPGGET